MRRSGLLGDDVNQDAIVAMGCGIGQRGVGGDWEHSMGKATTGLRGNAY